LNKPVRRYDVGTLTGAHRTPQGYLRAPAYATRTGVFRYQQPDGTVRREYRPADEVFKQDSLATLAGIPLTNNHPTSLLDQKNTREHSIGYTGDTVTQEGDMVKVPVTITDEDSINAVEGGKKQEVSCGYTCDLEDTPGVTAAGEEYDFIQKNIVYNHLAIVGKGRAGPAARIHLDSADAVMVTQNLEGDKMVKIDIDGTKFDVAPEAADAMKTHMQKKESEMDGMKKAHEVLSSKMEDMKKEHGDLKKAMASKEEDKGADKAEDGNKDDKSAKESSDDKADKKKSEKAMASMEAKKDSLEEELKALKEKTSPEAIQKLVESRSSLIEVAKSAGIKKFDGLSDLEIKKQVIAAKSKTDMTTKSEAYIDARFDAICEGLEGQHTKEVVEALTPAPRKASNMDGEVPDLVALRNKRMDEDREAWKSTTGKTKAEVLAGRSSKKMK
jgi:hypothetical protein